MSQTLWTLNSRLMTSLIERFNKYVAPPNDKGCMLWTGSIRGKGYGGIKVDGKMQIASRVAYLLYKGDPGTGIVCHKCNTPACVNPEHLYLGSYSDNTQQAVREGRQFVATGELNGSAKLNWDEVAEIRRDPRSQRKIAADYGVSQLHISRIKRNLLWKVECTSY